MISPEYLKENFTGYNKDSFNIQFSETQELKSCDACSGIGMVERSSLSDYHRSEYSTTYETCKQCDGDGRIVETKVFMKIGEVPYHSAGTKREPLNHILFESRITPFSHAPIKHTKEHLGYTNFRFKIDEAEYNHWK